ncbi:unnamed protein product, partial [Choristocarpus tenellus]
RSNGVVCHSCEGGVGIFIQVLGVLLFLLLVLFLTVVIVFLVGGLEAVHTLRRSLFMSNKSARLHSKSISESNKVQFPSRDNSTSSVNETSRPDGNSIGDPTAVDTQGRPRTWPKVWPTQLVMNRLQGQGGGDKRCSPSRLWRGGEEARQVKAW